MILDNFLMMADAQTVAVNPSSVASTSYVDTGAAGDDYVGCWFVVRVDTAVTSSGAATLTFALQTSSTSAFSTATTVVASSALAMATLVAGYSWKVRIPTGLQRYLRGYFTAAVTTISTGGVDMFITKDVDVNAQLIA